MIPHGLRTTDSTSSPAFRPARVQFLCFLCSMEFSDCLLDLFAIFLLHKVLIHHCFQSACRNHIIHERHRIVIHANHCIVSIDEHVLSLLDRMIAREAYWFHEQRSQTRVGMFGLHARSNRFHCALPATRSSVCPVCQQRVEDKCLCAGILRTVQDPPRSQCNMAPDQRDTNQFLRFASHVCKLFSVSAVLLVALEITQCVAQTHCLGFAVDSEHIANVRARFHAHFAYHAVAVQIENDPIDRAWWMNRCVSFDLSIGLQLCFVHMQRQFESLYRMIANQQLCSGLDDTPCVREIIPESRECMSPLRQCPLALCIEVEHVQHPSASLVWYAKRRCHSQYVLECIVETAEIGKPIAYVHEQLTVWDCYP